MTGHRARCIAVRSRAPEVAHRTRNNSMCIGTHHSPDRSERLDAKSQGRRQIPTPAGLSHGGGAADWAVSPQASTALSRMRIEEPGIGCACATLSLQETGSGCRVRRDTETRRVLGTWARGRSAGVARSMLLAGCLSVGQHSPPGIPAPRLTRVLASRGRRWAIGGLRGPANCGRGTVAGTGACSCGRVGLWACGFVGLWWCCPGASAAPQSPVPVPAAVVGPAKSPSAPFPSLAQLSTSPPASLSFLRHHHRRPSFFTSSIPSLSPFPLLLRFGRRRCRRSLRRCTP